MGARVTDGPAGRSRRALGTVLRWTRLAVPEAVVRPWNARRIARSQGDPEALASAVEQMRHLLGDVGDDVLDREARAYLAHWVHWHEGRWHPRRITRQEVTGVEAARAVREHGRGLVVVFAHHGEYGGLFASLARRGLPCHVVVAESALRNEGPSTRQYLRVVARGGALLSAERGVAGMTQVLADGGVLASAIDVPGRTVVTFAGRQVLCSAGALVAAARTGSAVVVATSHLVQGRPQVRLSTPLEPSQFDSIDDLAQEVVRRQEEAILAWPSAVYLPTVCWTPVDAEAQPGADVSRPA